MTRILLLQLEFPTWRQARHWSYSAQLATEEGLRANQVEFVTVTTPCFRRARDICRGAKFDQLWLEIAHNQENQEWFDWVSGLAPVRLGFIPESLTYQEQEYTEVPHLRQRKVQVESRLQFLTHVAASDERDASEINARDGLMAVWWPQAVPARVISSSRPRAPTKHAVFGGSVYGSRRHWLELPELQRVLRYQRSPETSTALPGLFDRLSANMRRYSCRPWLPGIASANRVYTGLLRLVRRRCFELWLRSFCAGAVVVNLPHLVKAYPGRVVEAMAVGRPVVSWRIPDRPRSESLFVEGEEILLFSEPAQLVEHLHRLLKDAAFARRIARNAQEKLRRSHTTEIRVRQILNWIATGKDPVYC